MRYRLALMTGVLAASFAGGALASLILSPRLAAQEPRIVSASQVNLVGRDGNLRAVLSAEDERGLPSLVFYGEGDSARAHFGFDPGGTPVLRLADESGRPRVSLVAPDAEGMVIVGDEQGRGGMLTSLGGTPMLALVDGGDSRMEARLDEQGAPSLGLFTPAGERGAGLQIGADGAPLLSLYGNGRARVRIGVAEGAAAINLGDGERTRLVIGVAPDGHPSVTLLDEAGQPIPEPQ